MDTENYELNSKKCRTCLNQTDDLESLEEMAIVEITRKVSYAELLKDVTNINVAADKNLEIMPRSICNCCTRKLKSSHAFIKQALEVNDKLWSLLNNGQTTLDCLQESEIDIQSCLEIKLENKNEMIAETCMEPISSSDIQFKAEISEENVTSQNNVNALEESEENEISTFSTDIDDMSSKKDSDFSEDETEKEQHTSSNEGNNSIKTEKISQKKQYSIESKETEDADADIAVPCLKCNKIFNNSKELSRHLRNTHLPEDQKCACPLCGIKFTRSCNMYKHMRKLHDPESVKVLLPTKEKPFECDTCHRRYTQKRQLNCHIKEKHRNGHDDSDKTSHKPGNDAKRKPEVRPLCFVCGSSFSNKAHLIVHMTRHTGEKPFKCDLCDRAFPRISDLTCHRRIHTGEKPFKCKLCEKAFRVSTKLATHMRSHTNERPYKCKQCERSFKYSKDLNIHNRIHTGERPYCCTVCGSTFTQSNSLKAHRMKLGHMDDSPSIMHLLP